MSLSKVFLSGCLVLLLAACATPSGPTKVAAGLSARQANTPTNQLVKQGLEYLRENNYEDAQKVFSAAVKLSPSSGTVHILNGIGYHLEYLQGMPDSKALAETAYDIAYSLDKMDSMALIQLGRLHIDASDYVQAHKDFLRAVSVSPSNPDALYGLMQAALLKRDVKTGLWAGDRLSALNTGSAEHQKLLALMYALAGDQNASRLQTKKYEANKQVGSAAIDKLHLELDYIKQQSSLAQVSFSQGEFVKTVGGNQAVGAANMSGASPVGAAAEAKALSNAGSGQGGQAQQNASGGAGPGEGNAAVKARVLSNAASGQGGQSQQNNSGQDSSKTNATPGNVIVKAKKTSSKANAIKGAYNNSQSNSSSDDTSDDDSSDGTSTTTASSDGGYGGAGSGMGGGSGGGMTGMEGAGGGGGGYNATSTAAQRRKWFDCDVKPGLGKAPGGSYGVPVGGTSGDQTLYLEPLPAPCRDGEKPKMAMIDAVIIRTVDTTSTSNGVNLLTGLQIFAGAQRTTTSGQTPVNASVIGVGNTTAATLDGVSGLVTYSMNIANSISTGTQVVARPTLTAIDRVPSTFYSGQVQTVGLNGGGVSGAQVSNVPTGTSLSVTPTFIDDNSMMLAVKVSRSFIDSAAPVGGFSAGISTQNHSVTANVQIRYGETLVLDGLTDRSYEKSRNGVPILQDIPIIQYLFSNMTKSNYAENVVVLITPRRVVSSEADMRKMQTELKRMGQPDTKQLGIHKEISMYDQLNDGRTNLDLALFALQRDSTFFRQFKNNVLVANDWMAETETQKFLDSAANTLYYH